MLTEPVLDRLTWRPLTAADVPAWTRLVAAAEAVDRTGEHCDESDMAEELADPSVDPARDTLAAAAPDGELLACGGLRVATPARDLHRIWLDGCVHPAARGRGLGRRLLEWQERRAAQLHRERDSRVPGELLISAYEGVESRAALARAAGYAPVRWFNEMRRGLGGDLPAVPPVPPGLRVVPFDAGYDEAVRLAHVEAFAAHWGSSPPDRDRWRHWYTGSHAFRPGISLLVLDGEEVAAYLLSYVYAADVAATGVPEAWVGQLGTRPGWRRRGLASLLLAAVLAAYREGGCSRAALNVDSDNRDGALGLYQRLGFTVDQRSVTWAKPLG